MWCLLLKLKACRYCLFHCQVTLFVHGSQSTVLICGLVLRGGKMFQFYTLSSQNSKQSFYYLTLRNARQFYLPKGKPQKECFKCIRIGRGRV